MFDSRTALDYLNLKMKGALSPERQIEENLKASQDAIAQAGVAEIPNLVRGATAEGFAGSLGDILSNSSSLTGARTDSAVDYLSGVGLGNRGGAVTAAGKLPSSDVFAIEDELNRRRQGLAGIGMTGLGVGSEMSHNLGVRNQTNALMNAQRKAQQQTQQMNFLGSILGSMGNMNFGGGGGGYSPNDYTGAAMRNWIAGQ